MVLRLHQHNNFIGTGTYRKVPTARRLLTLSMTLRDYDVIIVTAQSSQTSHWKTRTQINRPFGPLKHYHTTLC